MSIYNSKADHKASTYLYEFKQYYGQLEGEAAWLRDTSKEYSPRQLYGQYNANLNRQTSVNWALTNYRTWIQKESAATAGMGVSVG